MNRQPKPAVADISINTHIKVNNVVISIEDAINDVECLENLFPDNESFLVVNRKDLLKLISDHFILAKQLGERHDFRNQSIQKSIALKLSSVFLNFRPFTISGRQFKKVKEDEKELCKNARRTKAQQYARKVREAKKQSN